RKIAMSLSGKRLFPPFGPAGEQESCTGPGCRDENAAHKENSHANRLPYCRRRHWRRGASESAGPARQTWVGAGQEPDASPTEPAGRSVAGHGRTAAHADSPKPRGALDAAPPRRRNRVRGKVAAAIRPRSAPGGGRATLLDREHARAAA